MPKQPTWLITGTSSARSLSKIQALKEAGAAVLELNVTSPQSVLDAKAKEAIAIHGGIDVLVNNAGLGTLEDVEHEQWV
jgi:NAD(P)-dependent dehydrogenase (short-subunit alcohol dehydrogenase family)